MFKNFLKDRYSSIFFIILLVQLAQIIFFNQSSFFSRYDAQYWKDRFEHSQYALPLSKRILGDDGLYAYAGYRVVNGADPFSINTNKAPFGKYLIGEFIQIFGNQAFYALFFGVGSLLAFYFLSKELLKDKLFSYFATMLLIFDPLFFSQFWRSWFDTPQLFFLLLHFIFLFRIDKKRYSSAIISGLSLGFFIELKPPVLLPAVFLIDFFQLFPKRAYKEYFVLTASMIVSVVTPFFYYLNKGGILTIIKLHKYMYSDYLSSQLKIHLGAILQVIFLGNFPDIATGLLTKVSEWWVIWPICFLFALLGGLIFLRKRSAENLRFVYFYLTAGLLIFIIIPSYTRYLILLLPFAYILSAAFIKSFFNKRLFRVLLWIFPFFGLVNSFLFLYPKTDGVLNDFYYNISHFYFQDIYKQDLYNPGRFGNEWEFRKETQPILESASVRTISVRQIKKNVPFFADKGYVDLIFYYNTRDLGIFAQKKRLELIKRNQRWQVTWDWNLIFDGFKPGDAVLVANDKGKRGSIISKDGTVFAYDGQGYLIEVNPQQINKQKEQEMLSFISLFALKQPIYLQNAYLENSLPGELVPLTTTYRTITEFEKQKLLSYSGLTLKPYPVRLYNGINPKSIANLSYEECCTSIYSSYAYHGVKGFEKEFDTKLSAHDGGSIMLIGNNKKKTIFEGKTKEGEDVEI